MPGSITSASAKLKRPPSLTPTDAQAHAWTRTTWQNERAWRANTPGVLAVVTEQRARLIYFGAPDGSRNLLNAPYPHVRPDALNRWPNQGGHRFWLGPQRRWVWPPLAEWEFSAAAEVEVVGGLIRVRLPHIDPAYPPLTREYAWENGRLRCTVRWPDQGRPCFGMHVIPVDLPFEGGGQLVRTEVVPHGLVDVQLDGAVVEGFTQHPALTLTAGRALLRGGVSVLKAGFRPQALTIARPDGWQLSVHPGTWEGQPLDEPDHGYLSQIWVGGPEHDLAELEQLTPYLKGDASGQCASSIVVEGKPPATA